METFICAKCNRPLTDDGIELNGQVFDRACVTFDQVRADTNRRAEEQAAADRLLWDQEKDGVNYCTMHIGQELRADGSCVKCDEWCAAARRGEVS